MHHLKHHDTLGLRGEFRLVRVDLRQQSAAAIAHLERQALRQVGSVDPEEVRRILLTVCPCWEMEHRMGVCPLGLAHPMEDSTGRNTVMTTLKKSVIDQMVGNASPTNLLITRIAAGTDGSPSNVAATTLGAEVYRDVPTYLDDTSATQLQTFWYYGPGVANSGSLLQEWGIFGGGATGTANSGLLLARFLKQFDKNMGTAASGSYTFNAA